MSTKPVKVPEVKEDKSLETIQKLLEKALAKRYQMSEGISRDGKEIVVPAHMGLREAAETIIDFEEQMEEKEDTILELNAHPFDCVYAFHHAISEVYGNLISAKTQTFFGEINGKTFLVPVSHTETIKIPIGKTKVPGLPITMNIMVSNPHEWKDGESGATIVFTAKRKYAPLIAEIDRETNRYLKEKSLFKGKALDSGYKFVDVERFDRTKVIYSKDQMLQLNANIFTIITNMQKAIEANIPVKRGILLHGPYGTGKTLTALYAASLCVENDWTFILVRPKDDISSAIKMAQRYQPAVVFFEDIDAAAGEDRDADVNKILNTIDGALSKDSKVMVILTTNHLEKINPAMLRPGRLDAVIKLGALDKEGVIRFINESATDVKGNFMLSGDLDEEAIYAAAEGYVPAFLKEAVSKAALYAIARGSDSGEIKISTDDLVASLNELRPQYDMMVVPREKKKATIHDLLKEETRKETRKELDEVIPKLYLAENDQKVGNYRIKEENQDK